MLKTAIIQFAPHLCDVEKNTSLIAELLEQTHDADLVVLPELAFTGYKFPSIEMARDLAEVPEESRIVEVLHDVARKNAQYIISGFNEKARELLYNSSLLIGPDGLMGCYRKMHLFMNEKDIFQPGDGKLEVFDIGFCKLGMQICFDYLFPEPWRILAQEGAELIVHPSNLLTQNAMKAMPGIALMNKVYTITANRIGTEDELTFNGNSMILSPSGDVLAKASSDSLEILRLEIDPSLSQNKMVTPRNHVFNDRRPEQYRGDNC